MTTETRDSSEWGWLTMTLETYAAKVAHGYAGTGTPLNPQAPGYWVQAMDERGATVLYTGVTLER